MSFLVIIYIPLKGGVYLKFIVYREITKTNKWSRQSEKEQSTQSPWQGGQLWEEWKGVPASMATAPSEEAQIHMWFLSSQGSSLVVASLEDSVISYKNGDFGMSQSSKGASILAWMDCWLEEGDFRCGITSVPR